MGQAFVISFDDRGLGQVINLRSIEGLHRRSIGQFLTMSAYSMPIVTGIRARLNRIK